MKKNEDKLSKARKLDSKADNMVLFSTEIKPRSDDNPYDEPGEYYERNHNIDAISGGLGMLGLLLGWLAEMTVWGLLACAIGMMLIPIAVIPGIRSLISKVTKLLAVGLRKKASRLRQEYFENHQSKIKNFLLGIQKITKEYPSDDLSAKIMDAVEKLKTRMEIDKLKEELTPCEVDALVKEVLYEIKMDSEIHVDSIKSRPARLSKIESMIFKGR